jgi:hypothetical protein
MSDYCRTCCREVFGSDRSDFANIVTPEEWSAGYCARVLCERCGWANVDPDGDCGGRCSPLIRFEPGEHSPVQHVTLPADAPAITIARQPGDRVTIVGQQDTRFDPEDDCLWTKERDDLICDMPHEIFAGVQGVIEVNDIFDSVLVDAAEDKYEEVLLSRTHCWIERSPEGPIVHYYVKFLHTVLVPIRNGDLVDCLGTCIADDFLLPVFLDD